MIWCSKSSENVVAVLLGEKRAKREEKDKGHREEREEESREKKDRFGDGEGKMRGIARGRETHTWVGPTAHHSNINNI